MKFIGIIWNPTYMYAAEIEKIISNYGKIISTNDLNLDDNYFKLFIETLYNYSENERWKSDYKINDLMIYKNKKIRVLEILIFDLEFIKNKKNKIVVKKAQELKDYIRNRFNYTEINHVRTNIYAENAFHLTDNEEEYNYQKEIIKKFRHPKFVEDLESAKYYDGLPRFSQNVYDYLKKLGVYNKVVADVGSGTGRIAIDLLENKNVVYAIDPDANMRNICENKCGQYKNFISINGTDLDMNIPNHSVDYVLVSQSYHRFNSFLFKKECERVLKDKNNVIIIWYRVDFNNPIYAEMLTSIKNNYSDYETRYETDELSGAKIEEKANNVAAINFFNGNSNMDSILSKASLDLEEFLTFGLSLVIFPITHKLNNVSEVLKQKSFKKTNYIDDLKLIFNKYAKNNMIELKFNVQVHSSKNISH